MQLDELLALLDLEQVEDNLFRAFHPEGREHRLYGGQIMAQALMGAARTVPSDRPVHSLHGYFLRPGDPGVPAVIKVQPMRDGRSFSSRRVLVMQHGEAIFNMDLSFQLAEQGHTHQLSMPPGLAPPDLDDLPDYLFEAPFLSWRHDYRRLVSNHPQPPEQFVWFKANGVAPADPLLQTCLLVYESDNTLLGTARLPHRGAYDPQRMQGASLDHAMWFHHPADVNDWLLYAQDSPSASSGRGLNRGSIFSRDGRLVASCVQEGLIRVR